MMSASAPMAHGGTGPPSPNHATPPCNSNNTSATTNNNYSNALPLFLSPLPFFVRCTSAHLALHGSAYGSRLMLSFARLSPDVFFCVLMLLFLLTLRLSFFACVFLCLCFVVYDLLLMIALLMILLLMRFRLCCLCLCFLAYEFCVLVLIAYVSSAYVCLRVLFRAYAFLLIFCVWFRHVCSFAYLCFCGLGPSARKKS